MMLLVLLVSTESTEGRLWSGRSRACLDNPQAIGGGVGEICDGTAGGVEEGHLPGLGSSQGPLSWKQPQPGLGG